MSQKIKHASANRSQSHRAGSSSRDDRARQEREVRVYGLNAVQAVWRYRKEDIIRVFLRQDKVSEVKALLRFCADRKLVYRIVKDEELEKVSGSKHHEGMCAIAREKPHVRFQDLLEEFRQNSHPAVLVYLEAVSNPHNVGAILRSCAHFGVRALLTDKTQNLPLSGSLLRVSEGGAELVDIVKVDSLRDALVSLSNQKFRAVATSPKAKLSVFEQSMSPRTLFMFGAEDGGLTKNALKLAKDTVAIPGSNPSLSLNVATSVGICLGEYWRQVS